MNEFNGRTAVITGGAGGIGRAMAQRVLDAIIAGRFYILSDDGWRAAAHTRLDDIRAGRNPSFAPPV